jgi:hypothetical protein
MKAKAFESLKKYLEERDLKYVPDSEGKTAVSLGFSTDDFPLEHRIVITEDPNCVTLYSYFGFEFGEEKRIEAAMAIVMANFRLSDGCFDLNMENGKALYRIQTCYPADGIVEEDFFSYLIANANNAVDFFNDLLFLLSAGKLTIDEFHSKVKKYQ